MDLVGAVAELLAFFKFIDDVRVAGRCNEGRKPVEAGYDPVFNLARRHLARPADDARHAEPSLKPCSLAAGERSLTAIGPGEVLGAVVGRKRNDSVLLQTVVLQIRHDRADDVVELRHSSFLYGPTVLR